MGSRVTRVVGFIRANVQAKPFRSRLMVSYRTDRQTDRQTDDGHQGLILPPYGGGSIRS